MEKKSKYKMIMNRRMAITLEFMFGLTYYVHDNKIDPTKKVYSFEDTPEFRKALTYITNFRNENLK